MAPLSPLHAAVEVGDLLRVQAMLATGSDIEERQGNINCESTPLLRAAEMGHAAVARYLVERGADKEAIADGRTALIVAAEEGHIEVARILIEHGANKDAADRANQTALIYASCGGHVAVVEYLLEQGCNMDCVDNVDGWTALHSAAYAGHFEVAQVLLRFGAKIDVRDNRGRTPADLATRQGHHDIANAIRAEEIRRRDHGFKRNRSTIEGTEEHAASKRPRAEREAEEAAAAAAAAALDESDDDDDEDDDEDAEGGR